MVFAQWQGTIPTFWTSLDEYQTCTKHHSQACAFQTSIDQAQGNSYQEGTVFVDDGGVVALVAQGTTASGSMLQGMFHGIAPSCAGL